MGRAAQARPILAEAMKDALGQPVVIENRGGAGGTLGAGAAARAPADGYTLLMGGNTTHTAAPALFKSVPYDPIADFTPIARIARFPSVLSTNANLTLHDLFAGGKYAPRASIPTLAHAMDVGAAGLRQKC